MVIILNPQACKLHIQVVEEGAWAEGVSSALGSLGVRVLDSSILPLAAMGSARSLVNPATGTGVLTAVSNAAGGDLGRMGRGMVAGGASSAERQQLRCFLLQVQTPLHIAGSLTCVAKCVMCRLGSDPCVRVRGLFSLMHAPFVINLLGCLN